LSSTPTNLPASAGSGLVRMIEDDPSTAESTELILRKADLNTYVTDSGEEGIELAKL